MGWSTLDELTPNVILQQFSIDHIEHFVWCTNISGWESNKDSSVQLYSCPAVCHIYIVPSDEESVFMEITFHYL